MGELANSDCGTGLENIVFQSGLSPRTKSDDTDDDDEDDIAPLLLELLLVVVTTLGDGVVVVVVGNFVVSSECGDDVMGWEVADFSDCCRIVSCF